MAKNTQQQPDLAELLAAVMAHPDLPDALLRNLHHGFSELETDDAVYQNPEYVRAVLNPKARGQKDNLERAELADMLSKVLKHPSVPTDLFNAVGDAVNSLNDAIDHDGPEHIEFALAAFERKEREGGAT